METELVLQLTANGLSIGAIYSLVALGLVLGYKATEVLNFAYGDLLTVAAFCGWGMIAKWNLPFWIVVLVVTALVASFSYVVEATVIRRIIGQPQFAGVMLTIGLGFMIRGGVSMLFGADSQNLVTPWNGQTTNVFGFFYVSDLNIVIIITTILITLFLTWFLLRTRLGIAIQAASQNQLAAYLMGIPVQKLNSFVWAICGGIACICALLLAPITLVDISLWAVVLKSFAASVLGGFGNVTGAIVGGLLLGLLEQFSGVYLPDGLKDVVADIVLITVLMFYPHGIMGDAHGRRV